MSEERGGRELAPRPEEEQRAVTPREPGLPQPSTTPADRFSAGDQAHTVGLSEERAGQVVRQSSNARMVGFLATLFLVLFIPLYWLYDIGLPWIGVTGRMAAEQDTQYVTDVARGHALYLANCARCHSSENDPNDGAGGIGPPLNDQGKLYNTVLPGGLPGPGHLNPDYLHTVMEVGGRYVCGDPNSIMPAWLYPKGPLNYREVEEIILFMLATNDVTWQPVEEHHEPGAPPPDPDLQFRGWRDPDYTPPLGATPPPACWAEREAPPPATPAPVASPGTPESPRLIEVAGTGEITWVDPATGERVTSITLVEGETIEFRISNDSVIPHNFHIGSAQELSTAPMEPDLPGTPVFTQDDSPQTFTYTVEDLPENPQFACTVPGHYGPMHGDLLIIPPGDPGQGNGATPPPNGETPPPDGATPEPAPEPSP